MEKKETTAKKISVSEANFIVVARNVVKAWRERPSYVLSWISPTKLEQSVNTLEVLLNAGKTMKIARKLQAGSIKSLNTAINRHLVYVKGYLMASFSKKEAQVHYIRFGIVKLGNGHYGLPVDGEQRIQALQQLVKTLEASEYRDMRYGYKHWKHLLAQLEEKSRNRTFASDDSASLQYARQKKERMAAIRQTFNALILLIRANHPQHWRNELSAWGFRKEKY
jgi:hypothetical protein